jgi:Uma2 family endonuclease
MPTRQHSRMEGRLRDLLRPYEQLGYGEALPELSLLLPGGAVLIPDLVFSLPNQPFDEHDVLNTPPLLCIEVISPPQSFNEMYDKGLSYLRWGVPYCWIIDPVKRLAWQIEADETAHAIPANGALRAGDIEVKLADLFRQ